MRRCVRVPSCWSRTQWSRCRSRTRCLRRCCTARAVRRRSSRRTFRSCPCHWRRGGFRPGRRTRRRIHRGWFQGGRGLRRHPGERRWPSDRFPWCRRRRSPGRNLPAGSRQCSGYLPRRSLPGCSGLRGQSMRRERVQECGGESSVACAHH